VLLGAREREREARVRKVLWEAAHILGVGRIGEAVFDGLIALSEHRLDIDDHASSHDRVSASVNALVDVCSARHACPGLLERSGALVCRRVVAARRHCDRELANLRVGDVGGHVVDEACHSRFCERVQRGNPGADAMELAQCGMNVLGPAGIGELRRAAGERGDAVIERVGRVGRGHRSAQELSDGLVLSALAGAENGDAECLVPGPVSLGQHPDRVDGMGVCGGHLVLPEVSLREQQCHLCAERSPMLEQRPVIDHGVHSVHSVGGARHRRRP